MNFLLFYRIDSIVLFPDQEDQLICLGDKKGIYIVKVAYLNQSQGTVPVTPFPSSKVWSRAWPHRVGFFLWQAFLNRLPTLSNLHRRKSVLDTPNLRYLCGNAVETEDHLLVQCPLASRVWNYFINVVGSPIFTISSIKEVVVGWKSFPLSMQGLQLWKRLPAAIPWGLWKARNAIAFFGKISNLYDVIRDIKIDAFNWSKGLDCQEKRYVSSFQMLFMA
ncbi:hypothetical protein MKW98_003107 [Papaver atlanticum]|uniref:Reverse transcriptase zinc-binding domain-containing protein n=1 Tax=Papaver atlanticum TaxID=357466 RepID=A0AAD4THC3_9MAGN|nr:hypothetical protein MKW98_003107 [Papaver atlanticum]